MAIFRLAVALLLGLSLSAQVMARDVKIETVDWPPYYSANQPGNGPIAEITREALKLKGHTMTVKFVPWKRAISNVERGQADMVMGAYDTPERRQKFIVSEKLYDIKEYVIGLKSSGLTEFKGFEGLKKYKFGVTAGYAYAKDFQDASYLQKMAASSDLLNIKKLFAGRIDFLILNTATFNENAKNVSDAQRKEVVFLAPPLTVAGIHNLVSRKIADGEQLAMDLAAGIAELKANGQYQQILQKYGL